MSDFKEKISGLTHGKDATAGLYAMLIGMSLGNILPSVSDGIFFICERNLRDSWKRGEITAKQYWLKNTLYYYTIPFTYWALVALIIINIKGDYQKKLKLSIALIGGGAVIGILIKMMQTDNKQLAKEDAERLLLLQNHPEIVDVLKQPEFENIAGQIIGKANEKTSGINGEKKYVKLFAEREAEREEAERGKLNLDL